MRRGSSARRCSPSAIGAVLENADEGGGGGARGGAGPLLALEKGKSNEVNAGEPFLRGRRPLHPGLTVGVVALPLSVLSCDAGSTPRHRSVKQAPPSKRAMPTRLANRAMSQTCISFTDVIPEDEGCAAAAASSSSGGGELLQELDLEVAQKANQMGQLVERLILRLESDFTQEMFRLPKAIRTMKMSVFCNDYGGDVDEALKQQAALDYANDPAMVPPPAPTHGRGKRPAQQTAVKADRLQEKPAMNSARGKRTVATASMNADSGAAVETPGVGKRSTRSRLGTAAATPRQGLATPAGAAFTPRLGDKPRMLKSDEVPVSVRGSPLAVPSTLKARGKRPRGGESSAAASVALTLANGEEMNLDDEDTLKKLEGDEEGQALVVRRCALKPHTSAAH